MLRAVLLSVLACAACKDGGAKTSDPPAQGVTAGKVVEASGQVSATRDGKSRALAAGGDVTGDDTIETGADGHVVIHLAHNNVTWEVSAGKKQRVDASLAWTLAVHNGSAATVDQATSAAGRHAERSAADTVATANEGSKEVAPVAPGAPAMPAPAAAEAPPAAQAAPAPPPPPPPPPKPDFKASGEGGGGAAAIGAGDALADKGGKDEEHAKKASGESRHAAAAPPPALQALLDDDRAKLAACLAAAAPKLTLVVRVTKGTPKIDIKDAKPTAAVRACLLHEVKLLKLADGEASIELTK